VLPGYVWLNLPGEVRAGTARELELKDQPPIQSDCLNARLWAFVSHARLGTAP
jgi:hypothetical protein